MNGRCLDATTRLENGYGEATTLSFDALGRETERLLANGVTSSRAYDAAGRETVVGHAVDGTPLAAYTATYDAAGNRTGVVEVDGKQVTYQYDALGQLTSEDAGAALPLAASYTYDAMGNRLTRTVVGVTTTFTFDLANQLTLVTPPSGPATTLTHDAAGNVTVEQVGADATTYTWDGENRLTQVDGPDGTEEYAYDAEGLRVRKETAGGTVHYVLDGANVLIETDGSLVTQAVYTDLPGEWGGKFSLRRSGASRFYLPDHQGHSRQMADAAGDVTDTLLCDAWGVQVATTGGTVNPFAAFGQWGYYRDVPERLYVGARHYAPEDGRWLSRDPVGWDGGELNLYRYVGNRPTVATDPSGTLPRCFWECILGPGALCLWCLTHPPARPVPRPRQPLPPANPDVRISCSGLNPCSNTVGYRSCADCCNALAADATLANIVAFLAQYGIPTPVIPSSRLASCGAACEATCNAHPSGSIAVRDWIKCLVQGTITDALLGLLYHYLMGRITP